MIQFTCPCGKALHARDEYAGETTQCPDCKREITIPGGQARLTADAPRGPAPSPDAAVRRSRPARSEDRDWDEHPRPRQPVSSGMAIGSAILGVLSLFLCSAFTGVPALIMGGLSLRAIGRSEGRLQGKGAAYTGLITGALSLLLLPVLVLSLIMPGIQKVREAQLRASDSNNLMQIGVAMHNYHDAQGTLPPAFLCDPKGNKLLSWRVALLPYIEGNNLYNQFKLDEPWDSPNNTRLIPLMPKVYALPGDTTTPAGYTHYRVFYGNGAAFDDPPPAQAVGQTPGVSLTSFTDGTADTILVVEAATAVPWTKPDELQYDPLAPLPALGGYYSSGYMAVLADGEVRMIQQSTSQATLRAAITRNGNDFLGPDW